MAQMRLRKSVCPVHGSSYVESAYSSGVCPSCVISRIKAYERYFTKHWLSGTQEDNVLAALFASGAMKRLTRLEQAAA